MKRTAWHLLLSSHTKLSFGAIVIGRNEGARLRRCLASLAPATTIYVDSGSSDGSPEWARDFGVEVIELTLDVPFTAARARNAGFCRLREIAPHLTYAQFVDGDCEIRSAWPQNAILFLDSHKEIAAVCGRRSERYPEASIYNRLCDFEWNGPTGEVRYCGGDVMMRAAALEAVGGYRADLIAGEEPELCVRLRAAGWRVWRLDTEMTLHDAAMTHFSQWWRRSTRAGYAFAQGSHLHGAAPERHWVWESRRAWLWGIALPMACVIVGIVSYPWGFATWLIYPLQVFRQVIRSQGPLSNRIQLALFQLLAKFPEALGQITFMRDRFLKRQARLIEYK